MGFVSFSSTAAGTPAYLLEQAVGNGLALGFLTVAEAEELNGELEARYIG